MRRLRHIEDSRGSERSVYPLRWSWLESPQGPPAGTPRWVRALIFVPAAGLVLAPLIVVVAPALLPMVVLTLLATQGVALVVSGRMAAPAYESYAALLREGYCPACAYRIADLPPEPDGCSVCPECGAAWRR